MWPGLCGCAGEENAKKTLDLTRSMIPVLSECFIKHDRWTQSTALQTKRLQLLLLLLNIMPSSLDVCVSSPDAYAEALVHALDLSGTDGISGEILLEIAMELPSQATTVLVFGLLVKCMSPMMLGNGPRLVSLFA